MTVRDILRQSDSNKLSNINDLMSNFEFLLRDATIEGTRNGEEGNLTKEQVLKELGGGDQGFNLSDFIDPKFIESCIAPVKSVNIQAQ